MRGDASLRSEFVDARRPSDRGDDATMCTSEVKSSQGPGNCSRNPYRESSSSCMPTTAHLPGQVHSMCVADNMPRDAFRPVVGRAQLDLAAFLPARPPKTSPNPIN